MYRMAAMHVISHLLHTEVIMFITRFIEEITTGLLRGTVSQMVRVDFHETGALFFYTGLNIGLKYNYP